MVESDAQRDQALPVIAILISRLTFPGCHILPCIAQTTVDLAKIRFQSADIAILAGRFPDSVTMAGTLDAC